MEEEKDCEHSSASLRPLRATNDGSNSWRKCPLATLQCSTNTSEEVVQDDLIVEPTELRVGVEVERGREQEEETEVNVPERRSK